MRKLISILLILSHISPILADDQSQSIPKYTVTVKEYKHLILIVPATGLAIWAGLKFQQASDYHKSAKLYDENSPLYMKYYRKADERISEGIGISVLSAIIFSLALYPVEKKVPVNISMTQTSIQFSYKF